MDSSAFLLSLFFTFLFIGATISSATTIDFNGPRGASIEDDYIAGGVIFTNAYYSYMGSWASGEADSHYNDNGCSVPITGYFIGVTDYLSILPYYPDNGTVTYVNAYDTNDILIGQSSITGVNWVSINTTGISSFEIYWSGGGAYNGSFHYDDVVGIDTMIFNDVTPVPEPATMLLLGSGLLGLAGLRRKFRKR